MTYLTVRQVAEKFGVSEKTIRKLVKSESIPHTYALGPLRFPEDTLDDWAREPKLVASRWFGGTIEHERKTDHGNETGQNLGRALFLSGLEGES